MKLYHGTADYSLDSFIKDGPVAYPRHYLPRSKKAFCTSLNFDEAAVFAFRKTPSSDPTKIGIVIEFDGSNLKTQDYIRASDSRAIRDEKEIAVTSPRKLKIKAYHKYNTDTNHWDRLSLLPKASKIL